MTIVAPPAVDPVLAESDVTVGVSRDASTYVYALTRLPFWPSPFVTSMLTAPGACGGVENTMLVSPPTVGITTMPPNVTTAPVRNPFPEIVTTVAPAVSPKRGVIVDTTMTSLDGGTPATCPLSGASGPPLQADANSAARLNPR